ncbi:lipoyltransferase and lipoate-protein ligase [Owenweeksia hongkongensis DSM 17368]|uniref:lipoate--protein ligase n=1 Tax=Owenweeksia hongkongensis (strain DSM 17368 / CIP 108786 / JCM 12287 / NRRL B-23963 / UST20020801) TaxID=926562 RepID=G8R4I4_OWEHD|nr:lipoate--protein ligase [Owenweeksia hongkongensis]AEV32073.1 lipoyltransferase and lipoate-protein ligase [Owenweeksia hongkongensis DSM 17368]
MLCIDNPYIEPYFNQAVEEYFLKNSDENIFMLWRNDNAIIVGKHQNTLAEINVENVKERDIKVVRRLTGGGAVFHDLGNLNYTFIMGYGEEGAKVDFKKYNQPIIDVLAGLGVKAHFSGRNDILIDDQKFSGNAEHIYHQKQRVLHHGTLLYASNVKDISDALKVNPLKFEGKARKSVVSRVTNISSHLKDDIGVEAFRQEVMMHITKLYPDAEPYTLTETDKREIQKLADEKYSQWHWNFGYSPKYGLKKGVKTLGGHVEVHLNVDKGLITDLDIFGDFFVNKDIEPLVEGLKGVEHREEVVLQKLKELQSSAYFNNISGDELVEAFF